MNKNTWKKFTILFIFIFIPGTRCTGSNEALHFAQKTVERQLHEAKVKPSKKALVNTLVTSSHGR